MKLPLCNDNDTIQVIITVKGVPYVKTRELGEGPVYQHLMLMWNELLEDIEQFGDETE